MRHSGGRHAEGDLPELPPLPRQRPAGPRDFRTSQIESQAQAYEREVQEAGRAGLEPGSYGPGLPVESTYTHPEGPWAPGPGPHAPHDYFPRRGQAATRTPLLHPELFGLMRALHQDDPAARSAALDWYEDHGVPAHYPPHAQASLERFRRVHDQSLRQPWSEWTRDQAHGAALDHAVNVLADERVRIAAQLSGLVRHEGETTFDFFRRALPRLPLRLLRTDDPYYARLLQHLQGMHTDPSTYDVIGEPAMKTPGVVQPMGEPHGLFTRPPRRAFLRTFAEVESGLEAEFDRLQDDFDRLVMTG